MHPRRKPRKRSLPPSRTPLPSDFKLGCGLISIYVGSPRSPQAINRPFEGPGNCVRRAGACSNGTGERSTSSSSRRTSVETTRRQSRRRRYCLRTSQASVRLPIESNRPTSCSSQLNWKRPPLRARRKSPTHAVKDPPDQILPARRLSRMPRLALSMSIARGSPAPSTSSISLPPLPRLVGANTIS